MEYSDEIIDFIVTKIKQEQSANQRMLRQALNFGDLQTKIGKEAHEKFITKDTNFYSVYVKLKNEGIITDEVNIWITDVGIEILNEYGTYINYKNHVKNTSRGMMPKEYCLDAILRQLEINWSNQKDGNITPLNVTELLKDFKIPARHEFFKGLVRKLENDGYAEFKDINAKVKAFVLFGLRRAI